MGGKAQDAPLSRASRYTPSLRPTRHPPRHSCSTNALRRHPRLHHHHAASPEAPCALLGQSVPAGGEENSDCHVPATALGKPLNTCIAPATMPSHPSRNSAGTAAGSISSNAESATIDSVLSCTRGSPRSALTATNQRSKNMRAPPGRCAAIRASAAPGL